MKLIGELEIMTFVFLMLHMIVQQKQINLRQDPKMV